MKWLIASDLHGSEYYCDKMLEAFEKEKADYILFLGDVLYHGPRNDLPRDYAPKKVIAKLNEIKDKIFCVKGNCDGDVDQMVLEFPVLSEYAVFNWNDILIFATHGHKNNPENLPPLQKNTIFLYGHTHIPVVREEKDIVIMNPGSLSIPKNESWHGYMTFENGKFIWKDVETGEVKLEFECKV